MRLDLTQQLGELCPIPDHLREHLAPAIGCLQEWRDYHFQIADADDITLRVGTEPALLVHKGSGLYRLRFENHIGLTPIQPFHHGRPLAPPVYVEVISNKHTGNPDAHWSFFRSLLDDLFQRSARLPFTFAGPTTRNVSESVHPPTPLFSLHFLYHYGTEIRNAIATVLAAPHRRLCDTPDLLPLIEVNEIDEDVVLSILQRPDAWQPARGFELADRLRGYAPGHVWQRCPYETADTPENRFVLAFLRQLLVAAEALPSQRWWNHVPSHRAGGIRDLAGLLRQTIAHPLFAEVGAMQRLPLASQVLLRRGGYRDLLQLWQRFQIARRPLFAPMQQAIEVRDVALLYEMWVFFALAEEIRDALSEDTVIEMSCSDDRGLEWRACARFGRFGTLIYNQGYHRPTSYSVALRPDFTWQRAGKPEVVIDAKFRLERLPMDEADEDTAKTVAGRADLYKMHTYRDALRARAAVAVYPGEDTCFYGPDHGRLDEFQLKDLLIGDLSGIGALPRTPALSL